MTTLRTLSSSLKRRVTLAARWHGLTTYGDGLALQQAAFDKLLAVKRRVRGDDEPTQFDSDGNSLILLEHPPVYTVGQRSDFYSADEERQLRDLGADFYRTARGGLITFHGPGQLVVYPIVNLGSFGQPMGVRRYVAAIEATVVRLLRDQWGLHGFASPHTGVWVHSTRDGQEKKICAIGIQVKHGITTHGLALNLYTDLGWFDKIVPCGIVGKGVTSVSVEAGINDLCPRDFVEPFCRAFAETFDADVMCCHPNQS